MKKILALIISAILVFTSACSTQATNKLTANDYAIKLKTVGLPIGNIIVYTAENDPNKILGRPNQYTSTVEFVDTTLEQIGDSPVGGNVEVFSNAKDAESRKIYIDSFGSSPLFAEYSYINGSTLLRLDLSLTPAQAEKYKSEFDKIK